MKIVKTAVLTMVVLSSLSAVAARQPNILWVLTDDHRYDSIRAFNKMITGEEKSALGYVESPNTDKLAEMGTTFINTYCHAQGCAPSRASMHTGRYPFRSGIYEFEWFNNNVEHWKPSLPEQMAELGYQTFHVGKLGFRIRSTYPNGRFGTYQVYEQDISFHKMFDEGFTDWSKGIVTEVNGIKLEEPLHCDWLRTPEGSWDYTGYALNKIPGLENHSRMIDEKYDILRKYSSPDQQQHGYGEIIGGVCPVPAGDSRDGRYTTELIKFLKNPNEKLEIGSQTYTGVDPDKPLFANIGYDFPHTPVLPPKSFRDRFAKKTYTIPEVDKDEFGKLPPQLQGLIKKAASDHYSDEDKQQMVQDYYAFCAYGDHLIGQAVEAFVKYSKKQKQPWMIIYVCGDHGWRLNEHGSIYKFAPWKTDALDPIIVVSSDKQKFPAGKVVTDLTEFVDIAPTCMAAGGADLVKKEYDYLDGFDLAQVTAGKVERDYIIGESHAVTGPRATMRTKQYMFSIKSRPKNRMGGKDMKWAMKASYKELEPVLYDLNRDPDELNNLAFNPEYQGIAMKMKEKLLNIVIGDNRVEVNWNSNGDGTEIFRSNFAPDADDRKLNL
ncbi:sulfatase-like hydrolase/transferase [Pontiella agarivorans]|uniref:Sulfatase-like hydrolase/transferase n=1 Tax=Pontiella agarivorans TaxID=3038953 RepID=A0ABU5MTM8_9BACT|nr:sulfatase-like hydrolase/transferase [Pontiella agarivorans]MDZ8117563.1 sulfatase-like hydrolase/transferase [Pontiella agarivorans]